MGIFIIIVVVVFLIGFISRYKEDGTAKDGAEGDPSEGYRRQVEDAYNLYD